MEPAAFSVTDLDAIERHYRAHGFALIRGLYSEDVLQRVEADCVGAQSDVVAGALPPRYGSTAFLDDESKAAAFANYVEYVNELSPAVLAAVTEPALVALLRRLLGADCWLNDAHRFGVVYQDARPGRESGYSRIGWHADWQAAPNLAIWPSTAFTLHIDATSPANGFLRVVPGSHLWATPAPRNVPLPEASRPFGGHTSSPAPFPMPLGFEKIPGEVAVYCERGDLLLHDAYLWHSAARASDDDTTRRHIRGGYFTGDKAADGSREVFVKNAAR
ncbi:phytanoyl-CoA dioxygenase family protein [Actinocorallia sp. API 0066]|uniref:phytanoyl-CoA dioxygenase family protein n=1 Tax=Actinocorallia sp. API 0066 TaxID=2896846 RepID=UPI001E3E2AE9|nr:phytanoyl-CoA dioxygenase family protein [Actinocorallia sp. API 0066]MCD0449574.1 phytanoyl-CoA dioxygenase family protein [Actinocorallia sp. API 0066]